MGDRRRTHSVGADASRSRRELLAAIGASAAVGTAGCAAIPIGEDGGDPADTWEEGGPPNRDGWTVTFADRFDAGALDRDTWELGFGPGNTDLCEEYFASCIVDEQVWVDGETDRLVIETVDEPYRSADYRTATITTAPSFIQEYGYFEAKSRVPAQPGGQPAFWAWTETGAGYYRNEIDFYEVFGSDATHPSFAMHTDCNGDSTAQHFGGRTELDEPTDETFHVWGCEWSPEAVTFYVDGRQAYRFANDVVRNCASGDPVYLMLTTHVQPAGRHGDPAAAAYPYRHEFEWVRAWQRDAWRS